MSTETSELNQPNDGGDSGEPRRRFGFLHADTGVDDEGADRDAVDRDAVDTDDDADDALVDNVLVYDSTGDPDGVDEDVVDPQPSFTPSATEATNLPDP